ncbi:zinc finger CCCH domain-containing protein 19-like [Cynara cardunculus var. scolymus]|uniref:zinc finger CCCH domain-containing protein 19-like n=1 Tax=Cynara cardunculus var. scolymus TaxID=59895 RepID=UPI000D626ABD|nr:zinc finger CCCH domain-containing protein 19-like [Cynara cardunculus var. scolymus]
MANDEKADAENDEEETMVEDEFKEETLMAIDEKTDAENDEEETMVEDEFKEETLMANDEKVDVVAESDEEETMVEDEFNQETVMANDEKVDVIAENDEEETVVEDEDKSLDTAMETEKSLDSDMETEKSLDTELETEKSLDTEMETEEEANLADEDKTQEQEAEIETEPELPESSKKGSGGKRKRGGKISKTTPKSSAAPRKTIEEDVCFICFDGGDLVLCDRRNCPKAYHPSCVNRDEAFFQSKGRWNCGWHLCSICEKKAEYMCYTCTYSLCKACIKTSVILCVREKEKKGLCEACMKTVMLIEKQGTQGNVNFDDKNSWEHLFKDYWTEMKAKHNLSLAELAQAKNPWKGSGKKESPIAQYDVKDDEGLGSDNPSENLKARKTRRKAKKQKADAKEEDSSTGAAAVGSKGSVPDKTEWVSKELLEFVMHMRNGDSSVISQFEVQDLLLEYIKRNKLRDPHRKSQIICDARLENLFGKPRVAHFEMLKLLESHFLMREDSQIDDIQGTVVDTEVSQVDDDETNETLAKDNKDRKRKGRKKGDRRGPQSNREDYAAIDIHNISLIYLRRKLVEDLLDDMENFHEKIVGTFVRIRISGANQKQDIYRLVQVTGTSEAVQYTIGKRKTCTMLEILNLDKTETIPIDTISNQEFMEDECKRLRQSIKCGFISRLTVGDILDKAMELQVARVNDWLETEVLRLSHLRDRASDLGRKKELRECVEKLHVLKTPEERARRLEEFPLIHDDPTMDPDYGSEDDTDSDDKKQDSFRFNQRGRDQFSPRGDYTSKESWSGTPQSSSAKNYEFSRSLSNKNFSTGIEDAPSSLENHTENSWRQERDTSVQQPTLLEKPMDDAAASPMETPIAAESAPKVNETEKMWHYKDPSGKIQGPFSMVQLRKWSKNGYFPVGLRIWRKSDKEDDGIILTDALEGKFTQVSQDRQHLTRERNSAPGQPQSGNWATVQSPKTDSKHDFANLPSPTPNKSTTGWIGGQSGPHSSYPSGNEGLQSPTPNSVRLASSNISSLVACVNDTNAVGSVGSSGTVSFPAVPQNMEQGTVLGSQNSIQSSQLGQPVAPPPDNNMVPQMVQSVGGQNSQGWNLQPNPSMNMAGLQQLAYNQWTGVPNMVQNPVGNFLPQSVAVPQESWGQLQFPVNQPNMQPPPQPNVNWATMAANPNMGWVGPNPNWGPMVQGPQGTGNVNPTWVMPASGNMQAGWVPPSPVQGVQGVMPNQNWVAAPIQAPVVGGNGNPSWVGPPGNQGAPNAGWSAPIANQGPINTNTGWNGPPGNQGAPVANQGPTNTNTGWVGPPGNQGAPTANQGPGWVPPTGNNNQNWSQNRGNWGANEQQQNRGSFSGQRRNRGSGGFRGNRRHFNKQESFHKDGGSFHRGSGDSAKSSDQ